MHTDQVSFLEMSQVLQNHRGGKAFAGRPSERAAQNNAENNLKPTLSMVLNGKGAKGNSSKNQQGMRKRTAFGDITNKVLTHADVFVQAQKKVYRKSPKPPKPAAFTRAFAQGKRASNRIKRSASHISLREIGICVEVNGEGCEDDMSISDHCNEILAENEDKNADPSTLPPGVDPYDLDEDPFAVSEYAHSIFINMKKREAKYPIANYLIDEDRSTTANMRAILIDWLVDVQQNFVLYHETLYLAVKLLDSYLQHIDTSKDELQLAGATALLIACKVEERLTPSLDDFHYICDDAYTNDEFIDMEMKIFKALEFDISIPIAYRFLRRFSRVTSMDIEILTLARFILEHSLLSATFIHQPSSKMAAASLCLAMKMKNVGSWNPNHIYHSGYQENDLSEVMKELNQMLIESPLSELKAVRKKYSDVNRFSVAKTKPLPRSAFPM